MKTKSPKWFMIVAVVALIWNLIGVMVYIMQVTMSPEVLNQMPETERLMYENIPEWVTSVFAIAVFGGALGSLVLILKKKFATTLFVISLIAVLFQMYYTYFVSDFTEISDSPNVVMSVLVVVIAISLTLFSRNAQKKNWIA
jgi:nitrate/nitrite transporter NarK